MTRPKSSGACEKEAGKMACKQTHNMTRNALAAALIAASGVANSQALCDSLFETEAERSACVSAFMTLGGKPRTDEEIAAKLRDRVAQILSQKEAGIAAKNQKETTRQKIIKARPKNAIDLKLLRTGLDLKEVRALYDEFDCSTDGTSKITSCNYWKVGNGVGDVSEIDTIGEQQVRRWDLKFTPNEKLAHIYVFLPASAFSPLRAALTARHGAPSIVNATPLTNSFGAKFSSIDAVWKRGSDVLTLTEIAGNRDYSSLTLSSSELMKQIAAASAVKATKAAKDL
jgi:hypothetical protein